MSDFFTNFNANDAPARESYALIPAGEYKMIAVTADVKKTKDMTGEYLNMRVEIIDGEHKGKGFFVMITMSNKNPEAVKIGHAELGEFCKAIGVIQPKSPSMLLNKAFIGKVGVRPASGNYEASNKINRYLPINTPQAEVIPPQKSTPSWM